MLANVAPITPLKFDGCSTENLLLQQPQLHIGLVPEGVALKEENQPYDSPQVHLNKQPTECVTRPTVITKGKDEHEVDHGNFKTKEDIEVIAMGHSKQDC